MRYARERKASGRATANSRCDSACAVGLTACCDGRVVLTRAYRIRPPTARLTFTRLHGLGWADVRNAPTFAELWPTLRAWIDDAAFVAAHNAPFDRSVLHACCARYRLLPPRTRFTCTVQLARAQWGIRPTRLPDVCRRLRIPLLHHDAKADALACAQIVRAAQAAGWRPQERRSRRRSSRTVARPPTATRDAVVARRTAPRAVLGVVRTTGRTEPTNRPYQAMLARLFHAGWRTLHDCIRACMR